MFKEQLNEESHEQDTLFNYYLLEDTLNKYALKILMIIKNDYYDFMSESKKKEIDSLIENKDIVIVNKGKSKFNDNTLAHGGRTLKDGKIHFYPEARRFGSNEEMINKCKKILPHEIFHFFLQPDKIRFKDVLIKEMAMFYTEGLVERETRIFCKNHPEIEFVKANYGYNINFVNMVEKSLKIKGDYSILFSENDYLKDIGNYNEMYNKNLKRRDEVLELIKQISMELPQNLQNKFYNRARTIIIQDGNTEAVIEKIKSIGYVSPKSIQQLEKDRENISYNEKIDR